MTYENFQDLSRKTVFDKVLRAALLIMLKIKNTMDINSFFDKKSVVNSSVFMLNYVKNYVKSTIRRRITQTNY